FGAVGVAGVAVGVSGTSGRSSAVGTFPFVRGVVGAAGSTRPGSGDVTVAVRTSRRLISIRSRAEFFSDAFPTTTDAAWQATAIFSRRLFRSAYDKPGRR